MFLINGDKLNFSLISPHCVLPVDQVIVGALEMSSSVVFGQQCVFCPVCFFLRWIHEDEQQPMPEIPEDPQLITSHSLPLVSLIFKAKVCNFCETRAKIMIFFLSFSQSGFLNTFSSLYLVRQRETGLKLHH